MSDETRDNEIRDEERPLPGRDENLSIKPNWRDLLGLFGREEFQLREMERLGFWPPDPDTAQKTEAARSELKVISEKVAPLCKHERELQQEISQAGNVQAMLAEIRTQRIERVKRERAERKIKRAQEKLERAEKDKAWRAQTLPHLGRDVSRGLNYEGGDVEKLRLAGLPLLQSAEDIAQAMEISTTQLAWLTYHRAAAPLDHYHHFKIPKKSGGLRSISAPKSQLRAAQSWLLENVLTPVPVHEAAVAFRPGLNIADNARRHAGSTAILRIDLKDFFPSITFVRVKKMFERLGFNEGVSSIFALICTEAPRVELSLDGQKHYVAVTQRFLPQGACTSPAITNILCHRLDKRLSAAARKMGFVYTRYADDLIFSSSGSRPHVSAMRDLATKVVTDERFTVNDDKTSVMRPRSRQTVTGLVVNSQNSQDGQGAPRVSRRDIRNFRAFLHQYEKQGREAMTEKLGQDSLAYARGYLSFIHMVSTEQEAKIREKHAWLERRQK
ncbi:MAG TPA: reverse transcriptase domain-containing protein [Abditibacteriaceae bacterium]|jgi:hypothetical protein